LVNVEYFVLIPLNTFDTLFPNKLSLVFILFARRNLTKYTTTAIIAIKAIIEMTTPTVIAAVLAEMTRK